ncbi:MAG: RHS repeat-associated core domain-containing protein [Deltaproteobacteria bacterium]
METRTRRERAVEATPSPRTRYQLDDHLGSATLEVDASAQARVLTYEEYGPYGAVTYRATRGGVDLSPKRYRYTTKERDEETGLDDFGQRLYASWLARWVSADPAGLMDGTNVYAYVRGSPMNLVDPDGLEGDLPVTAYPEPPKGEVSGDGIHVFPHPADDGTLMWLKREGGQTTDAATFAFLNENYNDILARVGGDEDVARRLTEAATAFNDYIESRLYAGENPVDARKRWLDVNLAEAAVHGFFFGGDPSSPDYDDSRSLIALGFNLLPTAFAMLAGMRSRPRRSSRRSARVVMERAFRTKEESQAPDSRGLFKNLIPKDKPQRVEFQTARVADDGTVTGLTKVPDRPVEFVRMPGGELRMGRGGHIDLSNGDPVKFAGLIEVRRRADGSVYVLDWNNASGHYRPGAAWARQAGLLMNKFNDASRAFAMFRNPNAKVYRRSQLGR